MITKIKNQIRNKLIKFLNIDDLEKLLNKEITRNDNSFRYFKNETNAIRHDISHFQQSVNTLHNTVENVVSIGTDVDYYAGGRSWAVICIEGKMDIVKFVDLSRRDALGVLQFLKQFEAGKHCIDTPYKEMFVGDMFKF